MNVNIKKIASFESLQAFLNSELDNKIEIIKFKDIDFLKKRIKEVKEEILRKIANIKHNKIIDRLKKRHVDRFFEKKITVKEPEVVKEERVVKKNSLSRKKLDYNSLGLGVFSFDRASMTMYKIIECRNKQTGKIIDCKNAKKHKKSNIERIEKIKTDNKNIYAFFPKKRKKIEEVKEIHDVIRLKPKKKNIVVKQKAQILRTQIQPKRIKKSLRYSLKGINKVEFIISPDYFFVADKQKINTTIFLSAISDVLNELGIDVKITEMRGYLGYPLSKVNNKTLIITTLKDFGSKIDLNSLASATAVFELKQQIDLGLKYVLSTDKYFVSMENDISEMFDMLDNSKDDYDYFNEDGVAKILVNNVLNKEDLDYEVERVLNRYF